MAAVLSFDDGYRDFLEFAIPALERHGVRAMTRIGMLSSAGLAVVSRHRDARIAGRSASPARVTSVGAALAASAPTRVVSSPDGGPGVARALAFRCDGDAVVGAGHVARCIPLAAAFAEAGWSPVFVGEYTGLAEWLLDRAGCPRIAPARDACGLDDGWAAAVVDTYTIPDSELCAAAARRPLLTLAEARRCSKRGVVLDYHLDAPGAATELVKPDRLVAGPRYAPLDPRLAAARSPRPTVGRVLVTVGGTDRAQRLVPQIAQQVAHHFPGVTILAPIAGAAPFGVERLPCPTALVDVLPDIDLAVSAAGITAYELACAGVPSLVVALAANQLRVARACDAAGVAIGVDGLRSDVTAALEAGLQRLTDPGLRATLIEVGTRIFDGHGAERAAAEVQRRWALAGLAERPDGRFEA